MDEQQKKRLQGTYAGMHKAFLATNHPKDYARMAKSGELEAYLQNIGEQAADYYETLEAQMLEKAEAIADPGAKSDYINQISFRVGEIVRADTVYVKL